MAKNKTATGGSVKRQPQAKERPSGRTVASGGIVAELRQAIAQAEKSGKSRYRIAKDAGIRYPMLRRLADGENVPRLDTAEKIAAAIGLRLRLISN